MLMRMRIGGCWWYWLLWMILIIADEDEDAYEDENRRIGATTATTMALLISMIIATMMMMVMMMVMMVMWMWTSFSPNQDSSSSTPSPQQLAHRASSEAVWSDYSLSDICSTHEKPRFKCNCFYLLKGNTLLASSSLGSISTAPIKLRPCKKEKLKTRGQLFESKSCTRLCNTQQVISITESFFTT